MENIHLANTVNALYDLYVYKKVGTLNGHTLSVVNSVSYKKYFARRTVISKWSDKNKKLAQTLIERGLVARPGLHAINEAKQRGEWDKPRRGGVDSGQLRDFVALLKRRELAYSNFVSMPPSAQKTYAGFYFEAKQEKTRTARLEKIIDRLDRNLKPMENAG